jgi:hypothetical protein
VQLLRRFGRGTYKYSTRAQAGACEHAANTMATAIEAFQARFVSVVGTVLRSVDWFRLFILLDEDFACAIISHMNCLHFGNR